MTQIFTSSSAEHTTLEQRCEMYARLSANRATTQRMSVGEKVSQVAVRVLINHCVGIGAGGIVVGVPPHFRPSVGVSSVILDVPTELFSGQRERPRITFPLVFIAERK